MTFPKNKKIDSCSVEKKYIRKYYSSQNETKTEQNKKKVLFGDKKSRNIFGKY